MEQQDRCYESNFGIRPVVLLPDTLGNNCRQRYDKCVEGVGHHNSLIFAFDVPCLLFVKTKVVDIDTYNLSDGGQVAF